MKKLHFEKNLYDAEIQKRKSLIDAVNEFSKALDSEGIELTREILTGYISGGPPFMEQTLVNETISAFNKKGVRVNSLMTEGFKRDASAIAKVFTPHHNKIQRAATPAGIGLAQVSIKDGKALLTVEDKKEIAVPFTHYLQDKDKSLYDRLVKLAELLNEEDQFMNAEIGKPLFSCIQTAQSESSYWIHPRHGRRLKEDDPFIKEDSKLIVNPLWFGARKDTK